jgi:hypothetical protein
MIAEIKLGLEALSSATGLVKALSTAATEAQINDVKIGLQSSLLDMQSALAAAQNAQTSASDEIRGLKEEIMGLENWDAEKQRYQLDDIDAGAFAYTLKAGMENGEPPHWLCQPCFENRKKSVLQITGGGGRAPGRPIQAEWACNVCGGTMSLYFQITPSNPRQRVAH